MPVPPCWLCCSVTGGWPICHHMLVQLQLVIRTIHCQLEVLTTPRPGGDVDKSTMVVEDENSLQASSEASLASAAVMPPPAPASEASSAAARRGVLLS